ncbi:MAG: response regulator transcription factor [Chloroflexi bacterium]|nr:response regulator transcription factor [Chloroflexota bacterium]
MVEEGKATEDQAIRLLVVDSHDQVRRRVVARLRREADFEVIGSTCGEEAIQRAIQGRPSLVLLDIKTGDRIGLETCQAIAHQLPGVTILVWTSYLEDEERRQAYLAGARVYLLKAIDSKELVHVLRTVASTKGLRRVERTVSNGKG